MISTLLLCAGESLRMGTAKALLPYEGESLVARALRRLNLAQTGEIICVISQHAIENEILKTSGPKVRVAWNANPSDGMLSSVKTGLQLISPLVAAVMITLVDLPFLETDDFDQVARQGSDHLTRFRYRGTPAHPVMIPRRYFAEILAAPATQQGCAFLFEKYADEIQWLDAESPRGLLDIDTPEDY